MEAINLENIMYIVGGLAICIIIAYTVYFVMGRAKTLPIVQPARVPTEGFYGGARTGTSNLTCGRVSSEAEQLYSIFLDKGVKGFEDGKDDLRELNNLLSKLCCFKKDLMTSVQTITAVRGLEFNTQQDIQPIGDLTGRCFSKSIPERDLNLQIIKWRNSGSTLIHRLCTTSGLSEGQVRKAEKLFGALINDIEGVSSAKCISSLPKEQKGRFDPEPSTTPDLVGLRNYDGLY
jgi:hypothetical protein